MLGNWSFGDYYKQEAITWAWELLTDVWGLPKDRLYATCFEDELGQIPKDEEAAEYWRQQPGFDPEHIVFFGRDENFWEMADTGPCGPDSEIHLDRGSEYCDMADVEGHVCQINGDCQRFLELWNLVFIQYNRTGPDDLDPLPAKHVDTGMGFERIVSVLQGVDSNYRTDLFTPLLARIQELGGHSDEERSTLLTPYRVISDHARAAAFLIADGVVPGNTGRNYVCRMIIRRASRFGQYAGFEEPFLAEIADIAIEEYGDFYPELRRNRKSILQTTTEEERRFQRTVEEGVAHLEEELHAAQAQDDGRLEGDKAFELYATYGLPLEITRDIAREHGMDVDEEGFRQAMSFHREISGAETGTEGANGASTAFYRELLAEMKEAGKLSAEGVVHDPYGGLERETELLALLDDGQRVEKAKVGDRVAAVLPETSFYVESGGQVSDTGTIVSAGEPRWEISVEDTREPVDGLILHIGTVAAGEPVSGSRVLAAVHEMRRLDIMRNHTGTHLLHEGLRRVLGEHVRQAGSLVAPDRLRFDFTHPDALTPDQIREIEDWVNNAILANYPLAFEIERREKAIGAGATALFGETYGREVRTVTIGPSRPISYELCGGTHVPETGVIGPFLIISEGSAAAGIRRIEAITGREALAHIQTIREERQELATALDSPPGQLREQAGAMLMENERLAKRLEAAQSRLAHAWYESAEVTELEDIPILVSELPETPVHVLRELTDRFRSDHPSGVVVLASAPSGKPVFVAAVSDDLVERGLHAGELIQHVAAAVGGGGGGRPTLAQAGGMDPERLSEALDRVPGWVRGHLT